jgi:DNA-binding HxlR family transcriptional regulator
LATGFVPQSAVVLLEENQVKVFGKTFKTLTLDDTRVRILLALRRNKDGMTGSQLAKEIGVSQTMIAKAAEELKDLGIVRKEPLKVARNVKIYYLATRIIGDEEIAELKKKVPPMLQEFMSKRFKDQENVGLVFADQVMRFLASMKASDRPEIFAEYMRLAGEKEKDDSRL